MRFDWHAGHGDIDGTRDAKDHCDRFDRGRVEEGSDCVHQLGRAETLVDVEVDLVDHISALWNPLGPEEPRSLDAHSGQVNVAVILDCVGAEGYSRRILPFISSTTEEAKSRDLHSIHCNVAECVWD